jgi:AraC-like DNA-binding protein
VLAHNAIVIEPLQGEPAFMSGQEFERMLAIGLRMLPDPLPGLYAARAQIGAVFGLTGYLIQTSSSVGSVLHTMTQAEPLLGNTGATRLHYEPGEVHLLWDCHFTDPYVHRHVTDFILCTYLWSIQAAVKPGIELVRAIHFSHPAPENSALVQRYVDTFACPVYFNQPQHRMVLPSSILDLPLPGADPQLHNILQVHAQQVIEERSRADSLKDLARTRLHQLMHHGKASRENLAAALNMSSRTLHRKLREENTSYREMHDELRLERARMLLRDLTLTVQQVAEHSGFDEHNSFTRWFRQLTGMSPSEFRR